jgi:hypothetical protein
MGAEKKTIGRHAVLMAASPARRRNGRNRRAKERRGAALSQLAAISAVTLTEVFSTEVETPEAEAALPQAEALEAPPACRAEPTSEQVENAADESPDRAVSSPAVIENALVADTDVPRPHQLRRGRTWPCEKRVGFDMDICIHPITPYAEIYGLHPRFFDFDKGFSMVPAQGFGAARIATSEEVTARRLGCGYQGEEDDADDAASEDDSSDDELGDTCEYTLGAERVDRIQEECYTVAS